MPRPCPILMLLRKVSSEHLLCVTLVTSLPSLYLADPGFYVPNWLYLGKCHMELGHKEEAREWLKKAADHRGDVPDDKEVAAHRIQCAHLHLTFDLPCRHMMRLRQCLGNSKSQSIENSVECFYYIVSDITTCHYYWLWQYIYITKMLFENGYMYIVL